MWPGVWPCRGVWPLQKAVVSPVPVTSLERHPPHQSVPWERLALGLDKPSWCYKHLSCTARNLDVGLRCKHGREPGILTLSLTASEPGDRGSSHAPRATPTHA